MPSRLWPNIALQVTSSPRPTTPERRPMGPKLNPRSLRRRETPPIFRWSGRRFAALLRARDALILMARPARGAAQLRLHRRVFNGFMQ